MSDFLATALGLGFTLVVCLLAVQAILSPWLRLRRAAQPTRTANEGAPLNASHAPDTTPAH